MFDIIFASLFCLLFGFIIFRLKILDLIGTFAAVILGLIIGVFAGFEWLSLVIIFIIISFITTRYRYSDKHELGVAEKNRGKRNHFSVVANGLIPAVFAILWFVNQDTFFGTILKAGYIASVATVTGDTLSSEIGMLSKNKPVLITSFKPVPVGTHGGITLLGEIGGLMGVLLIGFSSYAIGLASLELSLIAALVGGTLGFNFDSILGAILERRKLIDNSTVNLLSSLTGGFVGIRIALSL